MSWNRSEHLHPGLGPGPHHPGSTAADWHPHPDHSQDNLLIPSKAQLLWSKKVMSPLAVGSSLSFCCLSLAGLQVMKS